MLALALFLVADLGLIYLWAVGHPSARDDGSDLPKPHGRFIMRRDAWDDHSIGHLLGSFALALAFCLLGGPIWVLAAFTVGLEIELAQAFPLEHGALGTGVADLWDVIWDALGCLLAIGLCAAF